MQNLISWETQSGTSTQVGARIITPQAKALTLRFPFGGVVWNQPTGVLVEEDGRIEYQPIIDVTRTAVWSLLGIALFVNIALFFKTKIR